MTGLVGKMNNRGTVLAAVPLAGLRFQLAVSVDFSDWQAGT
jgi:hypothetical protein